MTVKNPNNTTSLKELFLNPEQRIDSSQNTSLTSTLVLTIVLFVISAALIIVLLFFGPDIVSFIGQKMRKEEKPKLGFGFDGLSKQELKELRLKEEQAALKTSWFTKLPIRPPALTLKHTSSPLLLVPMPSESSPTQSEDAQSVDTVMVELDDEKDPKHDLAVSSEENPLEDCQSLCKDEMLVRDHGSPESAIPEIANSHVLL